MQLTRGLDRRAIGDPFDERRPKVTQITRPRETAHGDLVLALAHLREVGGGLHPKPHVGATDGVTGKDAGLLSCGIANPSV
jgi:hypothetical protein